MAETMGRAYGKYPRIITDLCAISYSINIIALQIDVMSSIISIYTDLANARIITILATLVIITYSAFGGIHAITLTDMLQFTTFTTIIFLLAKVVFLKTGKTGLEMVLFLQKQEQFQFSSTFYPDSGRNSILSTKQLLSMVAHMLPVLVRCIVSPVMMQSVYMSSGPIQVKKNFCIVVFFLSDTMYYNSNWSIYFCRKSPAISNSSIELYSG